jgi:RNA polymerase sigma-70 factor (ECF subfamily)
MASGESSDAMVGDTTRVRASAVSPQRVTGPSCSGPCASGPCELEAAFRAYREPLLTVATRYVRSAEVAEDIVEDVFCWLMQHGTLEVYGSTESYLRSAVRNQSLKYLEHQRVVRRAEAAATACGRAPGMGELTPAADQGVRARELSEAAMRVVAGLPQRCRRAYCLHRDERLSYREIADVMGVSVRTVENHIAHALKLLRRGLAPFR